MTVLYITVGFIIYAVHNGISNLLFGERDAYNID